ncbi:unnamed protein product [Merluccius merluccius]
MRLLRPCSGVRTTPFSGGYGGILRLGGGGGGVCLQGAGLTESGRTDGPSMTAISRREGPRLRPIAAR